MRVNAGRVPTLKQIAHGTAVALAVALASPGGAQGSMSGESLAPFSTFYVTTGTLLMDVSRLNPHFERVDLAVNKRPGFYTLSNDGYSVGLGGYGPVMGRLVLGGEFHSADMGQETSPAGKTNQLTTTYWMGTLGYAALTFWKVNIVPFVGIGTGSATVTLRSRDGGPTVSDAFSPTFDEVIESPGSMSTMKGSYVMVQPGLAIDVLMLRSEKSHIGLTLGLRFASAITPNRTTWQYKGQDVFGGPDLGPSGGTMRVIAGIGGFRLGR